MRIVYHPRDALRVRDRVARALELSPAAFAADHRRGAHGTRLLADARAGACWAIRLRIPELTLREIGEVVGLKRSSVQQAIVRAPCRFKEHELRRFAEDSRNTTRRDRPFPVQQQ